MFPCPRSKGEASRPPSQPTDCQRVTASHGESPWYEGRRGLAWELSEQRRGTCPRKQTELGFCIIAPRLTYFLMSLVTLTSSTPSGHKRHPWGPCPRLRTHSRGQRGRKRQRNRSRPSRGSEGSEGPAAQEEGRGSVRTAPLTPQFQIPCWKAGCDSTRGAWDPGAPLTRPCTGGRAGAPGPAEWPPGSRHITA